MKQIDLAKYGITGVTEVIYNPSYETLYKEETNPNLTGFDRGQLTELGAINVMTGVYTGRSPKDKFFVMDDVSKDTVWWTSPEYPNDNKPITKDTLRGGCFLWCQRQNANQSSFYNGGSLAGTFRKEYVYPSYRRGVGTFRRTRLRDIHRIEGKSR